MAIDLSRITRPIANLIRPQEATKTPEAAKPAAPAAADSFELLSSRVARQAGAATTPVKYAVLTEKQAGAFAALSPRDQVRYNQVFESISDNAATRMSMRMLLSANALGSQSTGGKGGTTLDHLETLARNPKLKDGIESKALLNQLVQDLAYPHRISQGSDNVICGATAALTDLALAKPGEYARLAVEMATEGKAQLSGGKDADTLKFRELSKENAADRSLTQRLLAVPLLESAVRDGKVGEDGEVITREGGWNIFGKNLFGRDVVRHGTVSDQMEAMKAALHRGAQDEQAFESMYLGDNSQMNRRQALDVIQDQLNNASTPALKIKEEGGNGHWVTVKGLDAQSGKLEILNGRGRTERVDAEELLSRADALTYNTTVGLSGEVASGAPTNGAELPGGGAKRGQGSGSIEDL